MSTRKTILALVGGLSCVFALDGMAAKGGKGNATLGSIPIVVDGNGDKIGEVFSIDRDGDPAVLVAIDITDPNGVTRKGIVGVIYDKFTSPDGRDVLYFNDPICQTTPLADLANVGLNLQMVIDSIYVIGDKFYMLQDRYTPPGGIINAILPSAFWDETGTCVEWVDGVSPFPVGGLEPAFVVEPNIYQKYPLYYEITYR